jgi:hypothetical protein
MAKKILQINFTFKGTRTEFEESFMPAAQPIADQKGMKWKVWVWDKTSRECGGIYLFENDESVNSYLEGPIIAQVKSHPLLSDISAKVFDVAEKPTAITRGPV